MRCNRAVFESVIGLQDVGI